MAAKRYADLEFEQVVRKYAQSVTAVCVMRLKNWADAEDCFQNTFVKLYTQDRDFADENHLKAWLLRVAINECKNFIRDNRRAISLNDLPQEPVTFAAGTDDVSWALMKLEPKYREPLYLHYCERCKVSEIAQILGKNPNTVKTLLKRGREKLKSIYGGDGT